MRSKSAVSSVTAVKVGVPSSLLSGTIPIVSTKRSLRETIACAPAVTRRLHGGYAAVVRRLHDGCAAVTRRSGGDCAAVTWMLRGGCVVVTRRLNSHLHDPLGIWLLAQHAQQRLHGVYVAVTWRSHCVYRAVTERLHPNLHDSLGVWLIAQHAQQSVRGYSGRLRGGYVAVTSSHARLLRSLAPLASRAAGCWRAGPQPSCACCCCCPCKSSA